MLARNIPGVALALIIAYVGAKSSHFIGVNLLGFQRVPYHQSCWR